MLLIFHSMAVERAEDAAAPVLHLMGTAIRSTSIASYVTAVASTNGHTFAKAMDSISQQC